MERPPSRLPWLAAISLAAALLACTSLPKHPYRSFSFPANAFKGGTARPHEVIGTVRTRVNFPSLDPDRTDEQLCKNYFNAAVRDLVRRAKEKGADAIIEVQSVVFLENGQVETYSTPECADDGEEGQVLAQAQAVKWLDEKSLHASPRPEPSPSPEPITSFESTDRPARRRKSPSRPGDPFAVPGASD